ncbi:hypothetical protein FD719_20335, partial [Photobacterium damselae subsp. damselae]
MGWLAQLEKQTIEKIFQTKLDTKVVTNSVINLTSDFISNKLSVDWLINELNSKFIDSNTTFYFECDNADILNNIIDYEHFT